MTKGILERLADGVVLGDGGYIVELEQRGHVVAGAFTPEVAITHPEAIHERDLGYPASFQLDDDRVLTVYYHNGEVGIRYVGASTFVPKDAR